MCLEDTKTHPSSKNLLIQIVFIQDAHRGIACSNMDLRLSPQNVLAAVGASTLTYLSYSLVSELGLQLHRSKVERYHHGDEPWALVTGASDGIGLAFVNQLAQRGFNIVLHGRNETKLDGITQKLKTQYPQRKFKTFIINAKAPADAVFDRTVLSTVEGLDLTTVVHNVGGTPSGRIELPLFDEYSASDCDAWVDINCRFATQLTRLVLPILAKNNPGLMIFISSGVTEMTVPGSSLYTAAKSYIDAFARVLKIEMKMQKKDVEIMTLTTGTVATASSGRGAKDVGFSMPSTTDFVNSCLDKVGCGRAKVTPWLGMSFPTRFVTHRIDQSGRTSTSNGLHEFAAQLAARPNDDEHAWQGKGADGQDEMRPHLTYFMVITGIMRAVRHGFHLVRTYFSALHDLYPSRPRGDSSPTLRPP
jgi:17beta-estradiol 17-dehydrogenase / very-long-chain 3-oxoacyl-CoA reductase